jgi:acetate---CoA ligase (ADP-forming)
VILTGNAVDSFAEVVARKARFAVIFAAGFSEVGEDGEALEERLSELVRSGETRLLGPNTNLNAFSDFRDDLPGPSIALITQSGHQGRPVFQGQEIGIALSQWAPTGNEVDLEFADFVRYFADQDDVGVVAAYIEGFKDGRSLMLAADHAAQVRKPLVVVKVGRTDEGRSMAKAHTGHLTGADAVVSAVFRQFGVTRVDGLDELLDTSAAFARTKRPGGDGVCVYAISGGTGAHMADLAAAAGLRLPPLDPATQRALHDGLIPTYLRVSNPVDCGGPPVMTSAGRRILELIVADPNVDLVICPITGALETMSRPLARDLVAVAATTDKPIFVVWGSPVGTEPAYTEVLLPSSLPVFRTFGNCVRAVRAYLDYWAFVDRYHSPFVGAPTEPRPAIGKVRRILDGVAPGEGLSEPDSKRVLAAYGIKGSRDVLCTTAAEAVRAANGLGYPVVLKAVSAGLTHKSDLGLVAVGVASATEVRATFADLLRRATRAVGRRGTVDGVLVCEQVEGGVEMVVGVASDPLFGPVVMCGLGGVFVEVLEDVTKPSGWCESCGPSRCSRAPGVPSPSMSTPWSGSSSMCSAWPWTRRGRRIPTASPRSTSTRSSYGPAVRWPWMPWWCASDRQRGQRPPRPRRGSGPLADLEPARRRQRDHARGAEPPHRAPQRGEHVVRRAGDRAHRDRGASFLHRRRPALRTGRATRQAGRGAGSSRGRGRPHDPHRDPAAHRRHARL